jgi:hypothetical protein
MKLKKVLYNPLTNKKLRPIIKFNGGRGAVLCHKCRKIIKENISKEEFKNLCENLFCNSCATELLLNFFKTTKNDIKPGEQTKTS